MANSLKEAGNRTRRLPGTGWMYGNANRNYQKDIALQHKIADEVRAAIESSIPSRGASADAPQLFFS